jgi:hypothetical protein
MKSGDTASILVSTAGTIWVDVWSSSGTISDESWQPVEYPLPPGVAGHSSVRLRWALSSGPSQNDIGWNIDDVELLGDGIPDIELNVTINNPAWGSVTPTNGTYAAGSSVEILATPANYFYFLQWSGDVDGSSNPIAVTLDTNKLAQAVFAEILTTENPTPLWWLAAQGYTNNFETAVDTIGANGLPLWQTYIAGLDPNEPASQLRVSGKPSSNGAGYVLNWNTVTDRLYTILSSTNLQTGFAPLPGATDLPATVQSFTNILDGVTPGQFYRIDVRKP